MLFEIGFDGDGFESEPCGDCPDYDEGHPDECGVLKVDFGCAFFVVKGLTTAVECDAEHNGSKELHEAHSEVSDSSLDAERSPLLLFGEEERGTWHEGAEVAAP